MGNVGRLKDFLGPAFCLHSIIPVIYKPAGRRGGRDGNRTTTIEEAALNAGSVWTCDGLASHPRGVAILLAA